MTFSIANTSALPRRTFLQGLGAAMALPMLEAMGPRSLFAAAGPPKPPVRLGFTFFPNGAIMDSWKPTGSETDWSLSPTLKPLGKYQRDVNVFTGLTQHHARANGDGGGDHARNASAFLTGAQPRKTSGADIHVGKSADQVAAELIGQSTKLPSLELGVERGRNAGNCDSGYSCAYSSNISWKTPGTPMAKEINPKLVFERLFGSKEDRERGEAAAKRNEYRQSILDTVADDAALLRRKLGRTDQRKLDEYFTSVRELETRIERSATGPQEVPEYDVPVGIPKETIQHMRLMFDLQVLAFQTDTTRISSFMLANAGSNRTYPEVEVRSGHHSLSHHRNKEDQVAALKRIDLFLSQQFAYFVNKLATVKEGEGRLLDNCLMVYGSAISDGNRHRHEDLPILVAGNAGGRIKTGRLIEHPVNTPLNNLFLSMIRMAGGDAKGFGDSTGPLSV